MAGRLACFLTPGRDLGRAIERVRLAERLGYDAAFTTHIAGRDALMVLAAYAGATERIALGTGVLPVLQRHPIALAQEAATLDELSGGRLVLGIGPSHALTMEGWYGIPFHKPFTQMREYVTILREVFTTDGTQFSGEFYDCQFSFLGYGARKDLPIYLGAVGPRMCRFTGEAADGAVLWACMPSYIEGTVVPAVRAGAEAAGRGPAEVEIVAAIPCCVTESPDTARAALRGDFFPYMSLPTYRRAIEGAGFAEELDAYDKAGADGDFAGQLAAISDRLVDHFAGIGSAGQVRDKIAEYRAAGVTLPAVGAFDGGGTGIAATLEAVAGA